MVCRVVVGRPLLQGPSGFRAGLSWLFRHDASHDLPDEDTLGGDPWDGALQFLVGHVIVP